MSAVLMLSAGGVAISNTCFEVSHMARATNTSADNPTRTKYGGGVRLDPNLRVTLPVTCLWDTVGRVCPVPKDTLLQLCVQS